MHVDNTIQSIPLFYLVFSLSAGEPRGVIATRGEGGLLDDVVHNLPKVHHSVH